MELTILMPCLNEAETIAICIEKAKSFLIANHVDGEILIADNGSDDDSVEIAKNMGVRVISVSEKGYGNALIAGCEAAQGEYVIMGDADDSYDFSNLMPFMENLRAGYELVMGNRFRGGIEKGAMPWLHKYIGNPVLSFVGRVFFGSRIGDFHCGLRGYRRESILKLGLKTAGMEYASEMVVMAELAGLRICEVPTVLKKDGRSRAPHLRSFRDGWRHLKFLLMYSPKWLFLYPGMILLAIGVVGGFFLSIGPIVIDGKVFSIHTLLFCMMAVIVGVNIIFFYIFTKLYAQRSRFIPKDKALDWIENINMDKGILAGFVMAFVGFAMSVGAFVFWMKKDFGQMDPELLMRILLPAATLIEVGIELFFASFFVGILKIRWKGKADKG